MGPTAASHPPADDAAGDAAVGVLSGLRRIGEGSDSRDLTRILEGWVSDLRGTLREEMRELHIEMIRELDSQRHEMRALLAEERAESESLRAEVAVLRDENSRLRGPLGLGVMR